MRVWGSGKGGHPESPDILWPKERSQPQRALASAPPTALG